MALNDQYQAAPVFQSLGSGFADPVHAAHFPKKILRYKNQAWAKRLGFGELSLEEWQRYFCEFHPLPDNIPQPLALRYHGHQFTHYNPELGDGRGFLYAQVKETGSDKILDFGTKGSGQTPYSRSGDGRLTLKGAVREALATAYLEYQGVNTSKTFCFFETGEDLIRNDEPSPTRSAVLTRLSHSHIRFGTFQRLAYFKEKDKMDQLIDYCLENYYPKTKRDDFFVAICEQVAATTAQWMIHGFVHGVLNTDNINITGESFDYGPYRLLPHYDPKFTAAYFDHQGLYAYGRQPTMIMWNLEQLMEALKLCISDESFYARGFEQFKNVFNQQSLQLFFKKIGADFPQEKERAQNLFYLCLQFLEESRAPYEAFFHHLYYWHQELNFPLRDLSPQLYDNDKVEEIQSQLGQMGRSSQVTIKEREDYQTLLIDEIEAIWSAIDKDDNWNLFENKLKQLKA